MTLNNIRRKADFLQHDAPQWARTLWPRIESLNWFIKANKARLEADGAITKIGREWFVDIGTFPDVARGILNLAPDDGQ